MQIGHNPRIRSLYFCPLFSGFTTLKLPPKSPSPLSAIQSRPLSLLPEAPPVALLSGYPCFTSIRRINPSPFFIQDSQRQLQSLALAGNPRSIRQPVFIRFDERVGIMRANPGFVSRCRRQFRLGRFVDVTNFSHKFFRRFKIGGRFISFRSQAGFFALGKGTNELLPAPIPICGCGFRWCNSVAGSYGRCHVKSSLSGRPSNGFSFSMFFINCSPFVRVLAHPGMPDVHRTGRHRAPLDL